MRERVRPMPDTAGLHRARRAAGPGAVLVLLGAALLAAAGCSNGRGADGVEDADESWFPLVEDARWTYDGHFEGTVYRNTLGLRKLRVDERTVLAFYDLGERIEGQLLMGNMFGDELFRRDGDVLYVADEHRPEEEHVLLRFPLRAGDTTEYRVGSRLTRTTVEGEDQVTVPAGTFDTLRLSVVVIYDSGDESRHTVWLARGVGLVKWKRATGRLDELVHYAIR